MVREFKPPAHYALLLRNKRRLHGRFYRLVSIQRIWPKEAELDKALRNAIERASDPAIPYLTGEALALWALRQGLQDGTYKPRTPKPHGRHLSAEEADAYFTLACVVEFAHEEAKRRGTPRNPVESALTFLAERADDPKSNYIAVGIGRDAKSLKPFKKSHASMKRYYGRYRDEARALLKSFPHQAALRNLLLSVLKGWSK